MNNLSSYPSILCLNLNLDVLVQGSTKQDSKQLR